MIIGGNPVAPPLMGSLVHQDKIKPEFIVFELTSIRHTGLMLHSKVRRLNNLVAIPLEWIIAVTG